MATVMLSCSCSGVLSCSCSGALQSLVQSGSMLVIRATCKRKGQIAVHDAPASFVCQFWECVCCDTLSQ